MEIAPGIYGLSQKQGGWVHAYLIDDGQDLSLVDTLFSSDGQKILELLSSLGKRPSDIKRIILTHAHRAHLGGLARLKELTGAQVYAHEWEADLIAANARCRRCRGVRSRRSARIRTKLPTI